MKALTDTSVLVAGILKLHPDHQRAVAILQQIEQGQLSAVVSAHSLAETYSTLTRMPLPLRVLPLPAWRAVEANLALGFTVFALTAADYRDLLEHLAQNNIAGGVTYDGVIAWVAYKAQVDQIITFNAKDFRRVVPALAAQVVIP